MPPKKTARRKAARKPAAGASSGPTVACWEDDPGDPKSNPPLSPISVQVPNQSAKPLPYKLAGRAPAPPQRVLYARRRR
jgi:hypothetical protein